MKAEYFDVRFYIELPEDKLPSSFSILTASNPLGGLASDEESRASNKSLGRVLSELPVLACDADIGDSFDMLHNESGFVCGVRLHMYII